MIVLVALTIFACVFSALTGELKLIAWDIVIAIIILFLLFIFLLVDIKKDSEKIILKVIKKSIKLKDFIEYEEIKIKLVDSNFIISKVIEIKTIGFSSMKLYIDNQNKRFIYKEWNDYSKSYKFSDLINYEVYENGKSRVQGSAGSALIGGAFFGLPGLIVGSSMGRNIHEKSNQLKLIMRLNDFECPQIVITYIDDVEVDKNDTKYSAIIENLQSVCSMFEYMLNQKTLEQ